MAMKARGRYGGSSLSASAAPPISPRVASVRPLSPRIWIAGGRFGTSSDWIGGRCAANHTTAQPAAACRLGLGLVASGRPFLLLFLLRFAARLARRRPRRLVVAGASRAVARRQAQIEGGNRKCVEAGLAARFRLSSTPHSPGPVDARARPP